MKKSFFNFEFKSVEIKDGKVKIKGFASTPDVDRYDDIVDTKAFESSMSTYMKNPIILLQHDSDKPIGKCISYDLSDKGLEITAEITENTDGVMEKLTNKVLGAFSIGFIAKKWEMTEKEINGEARRIREIKDLDLVEISVVSTPANANAVFTISKSLKKLFDEVEKEADTEQNEEEAVADEVIEVETIEDKTEDEKTAEIEENDAEEKACSKKPKKMKLKKDYFEEKRVLLAGELSVGDLVRFTKCDYNMWEGTSEIEVEQGEIIKIIENEDITNPTLYILEYELTLDGFVPSDEMCVCSFRETTIEKITDIQMKEVSDELIENGEATDEANSDDDEKSAETQTDESQVEEEIDETDIEINIEEEVEKHFATKSLKLDESLEAKQKLFEERIDEKLSALEAKEIAIKAIYNENAEIKKAVDAKLEEAKAIMERLLKIAINKGNVVSVKKQYNPYGQA